MAVDQVRPPRAPGAEVGAFVDLAEARGHEVREALASPAIYADPMRTVEVRETHISWIFLVGDRAFKLKKPIVLPFVDYGTPERRREMCREEVRLNRRLAPDLYLGVRSVVATPEGMQLGSEDDPNAVDYLVEMRRYDEADTLAEKLRRGELRHRDAVALGRMLAQFHDHARRVSPPVPRALPLERVINDNVSELLDLVEQRAEVDQVLAVQHLMHAFIVAHTQLLDTRAREGLVREGHGDLRADHVLLTEPLQVVDCLEFEAGLRELDVADEISFLVMDLEARRGSRFARDLVTAYRTAGGDPGGDSLIAFHACHRALVRAKVAMLRAAQQRSTSSEHGRESTRARDLIALAERFSWRARMPLVIVVCGVPATGKSRLARSLAKISGLPHLSSDVTRKRIAGIDPHERADPDAYSAEFSRRTYADLGRQAAGRVGSRGGALVDATFRHRADREAFAEAFGAAAPVLFVECVAPLHVLTERAARRDRRRTRVSDADLAVVTRESESWEPLDELPPEAHLILRSDRPVDAQITDLVGLLDQRLGWLAEQAKVQATAQP